MKHTLSVTLALIVVFIAAQLVGLGLLAGSLDLKTDEGVTTATYADTLLGPRPDVTGGSTVVTLLAGVLIGTLILLVLVRFRQFKIWKAWYFLAVFIAVSVSMMVIIPYEIIAWLLGLALALWKIFKPNVFVHNITEVLIYAAIALIFVPLFRGEMIWASILLIIISLYDMFAVWKSKHMVSMAKFQTQSKVFAGLFIPYKGREVPVVPDGTPRPSKDIKGPRHAILGGGDIAFPLLFAGTFMEFAALRHGITLGFLYSLIIVSTTTIALALLFILAKKDRFYPAMPFISAGCFIGYGIAMLLV